MVRLNVDQIIMDLIVQLCVILILMSFVTRREYFIASLHSMDRSVLSNV